MCWTPNHVVTKRTKAQQKLLKVAYNAPISRGLPFAILKLQICKISIPHPSLKRKEEEVEEAAEEEGEEDEEQATEEEEDEEGR